jgi:uncharacterized protein with ParB-like and HNH nuclease domain
VKAETMEVQSLRIAKVFSSGGEVHYVLPHFQREYAWENEHWETLMSDASGIYDVYSVDEEPEHFMGALVVINDGTRGGTMTAFKLVDGQQRLTTISLALAALGDLIKDREPNLYRKIRRLLINEDEPQNKPQHYKLLPTGKNDDRAAYIAVINGEPSDHYRRSRIPKTYKYFYRQFNALLKLKPDTERWFRVFVNAMHVVFIELNKNERPYEIFESLNAKGRPLEQPDLVRNYIAMKLPGDAQESVFNQNWLDIESRLDENRFVAGRIGELTAFFRHYLALRSGVLPNQDHVYARLRDRMERDFAEPDAFIGELETLRRFAEYYSRLLHPDNEPDLYVRGQLERLNVVESSTANPFLLALYEWYDAQVISRDVFLDALSLIENYFVRRFLAGEQTAYTNRMFPLLIREVDSNRLTTTLANALLGKNYPTDSRIREELPRRSFYNRQAPHRLTLLLLDVNRRLSEGSDGYTILNGEPTIEHILPQTLSADWKAHVGPGAEDIYREYLHTIGNLTLVTQEWNSQLSNSSFSSKRVRLADHALRLNALYFSQPIERWEQAAIEARAAWLTEQMLALWPAVGQSRVRPVTTNTTPVTLLIVQTPHPVQSWRDVAYTMANELAGLVGEAEFNHAVFQLGAFFRTEGGNRARQLENAPQWWLTINLSSRQVMNLCEQLAAYVGLQDSDWEVVLKE